MQHLRKILLGTAAAWAVVLGCATKQATVSTPIPAKDPRWVRIDSLAGLGQYATALAHVDVLKAEARAKDDAQNEFRAWMYASRLGAATGQDAIAAIQAMEARAQGAAFPLKQLLWSVVAEQWWQRYQADRWTILQRTNTQDEPTDPATWGQAAYMKRVIDAYEASLSPWDSLKVTPAASISDLLTVDGEQPARPEYTEGRMLSDVLAQRALAVFGNSETRLTEPAWRFRLDDPRVFSVPDLFAAARFTHRDSTSWEFQALRLYQRLEAQHLADARPDLLVATTLARLDFAVSKSTLPDKDSLHLRALAGLRDRVAGDAAAAEVMLAQARWHEALAGKYDRLTGVWKEEKRTALALCDEAMTQWPGSFGAKNAAAMKASLLLPTLTVRVEEAERPDAPFRVAVDYANLKHVYLRLVKAAAMDRDRYDSERYEKVLQQKPERAWDTGLPDDGDLNAHLTELPVDGLPLGNYVLFASNDARFRPHTDMIAYADVRITRLACTGRRSPEGPELLVMDRWTGAPKSGAAVDLLVYRWGRNGQEHRKIGSYTTDAEGRVRAKMADDQNGYEWVVRDGADQYTTARNYYSYSRIGGTEADPLRTFLFTDRAIYRPGQPVHFKGIVTAKHGAGSTVQAGYPTVIELFNANGDKADSLAVTTDAFGAFQGTFTAPASALTGAMRLSERNGSVSFRVEEYKRPTFEVVFDPMSGQPKLEQEASMTGVAKSYAGVPLDGAQVQWRVTRAARIPWWCFGWYRGFGWGTPTEVASGVTEADAQGRFTVTFMAQADPSVPREADPTFTYTVEANVTDVNGETQRNTATLNVGYRSIDIDLGIGEAIDRSTTDSLRVQVKNLNGEAVAVPVDVRIVRVDPGPQPLRARAWERPDRSVMTKAEFQTKFPGDVYDREDDPLTWPVEATVLERSAWDGRSTALPLTGIRNWDVGAYRVEVTARDADGREVKATKAITVLDPDVRNTGFTAEGFHVEVVKGKVEPGEKAVLLVGSALPEAHVLMEVERAGLITASRWITLHREQQRIDLPVQEGDRGGFSVHLVCVERGRAHVSTQAIDVPWSNKDLQVEWMSFRDKLLPGQQEEWRLRITGPKKEKVAAQLLGVMYDASLDHFVPHGWNMDIWPSTYAHLGWEGASPFGLEGGNAIWRDLAMPGDTTRIVPFLNTFGLDGYPVQGMYYAAGATMRGSRRERWETAEDTAMPAKVMADEAAPAPMLEKQGQEKNKEVIAAAGGSAEAPPVVRTDFRETAFFFPDLLTDKDGAIVLRFKTPDALTRWKVMGLAHTKDLKLAQFTKEVVTSKPLMVVPNLPRFLREGDRITLTTKINALEGTLTGTAKLELFDSFTNKPIDTAFGLAENVRAFTAAPGVSANVAWDISVPEGVGMVSVRITATAGTNSDGEERPLPVLTDKVLVTESLPLWSNTAGTKTFLLDKLKNNTSTTLRTQGLKLEYTPNPAWFAVQALPYLMEYPHECAEQLFSRFYANSLAANIVQERPAIRKVFEQWKQAGPEAFVSALDKDPGLKSVVLEETPWVVNARSERESQQRVALLFDLQRMSDEREGAMRKLSEMQLGNGAWPWWSGMRPSRYITEHIVAGFGHLEKLGAADLRPDGRTQVMLRKAVQWLDNDVDRAYNELIRRTKPADLEKYVPSADDIHYLYARSFFPRWPIKGITSTAVEFYKRRLKDTWLQNALQQQAMIALALDRLNDWATAELIMRSLSERATQSEELGMYWKGFNSGYEWWSFPTETHALLIEAYHDVTGDAASVNALRTYLLKLKQTTDWKTTKATAEACYALLLSGNDWLVDAPAPVITVGGVRVQADKSEAGTGTIERAWSGDQVKPAMGEVTITSTADKPSWGALHWQYLERMDKVTPHESPLSIERRVMLTECTDAGPQLIPLDQARTLKPGDQLTIRIELRTDRYVDYVHLKDLRAAGLEPEETLSGYRYEGGLGYYRTTRDASVNFFFDRIAPGTYVLEYTLRVTHAGDFSNGITTAMCMYAPEFSSHAGGVRVQVAE
ncbi:MAG: MG2 domain-containing protein [Flavobacteriales bacterium]